MIEVFSGFLNSIKQTSPIVFSGLAIACGIILFSDGELVKTIGLQEFKETNKPYIGGCFVLSISIVFVQWVVKFHSFLKSKLNERKRLKTGKTYLENLTPDEKAYLAAYVFGQKSTLYFLEEDGIKGGLVAQGILFRSSNMGNMRDGFAYNIQPWAKDYLENNRDLLEGYSQKNMLRHERI